MMTALDRPFNQLLFRLYASDLSEAVFELSREQNRMDERDLGRDWIKEHAAMHYLNVQKINDIAKARPMSITGFQPGAIQAKLDALKAKATDRRAQSMAKLDDADTKLAAVDAELERVAAQIEKEADDAMQEFAQHTNGGPA